MVKNRKIANYVFALSVFVAGCSQQESSMLLKNAKDTALEFSSLMASRNYSDAYEMTSNSFKDNFTLQELKATFEDMIPIDWGEVSPIEIGETMKEWPAKEMSDIAWVYVVLGGDVYSEALILIVTEENGSTKIRDIEFGRP